MHKKFLAMTLSATMILSVGAFSVSATEEPKTESDSKIYFDIDSTGWKNYSIVYCHIWSADGAYSTSWQTKAEKCNKESDGLYSYDLSKWTSKTEKEIKSTDGKEYCVIFSTDAGSQTYDLVMSGACIGDTVYRTGESLENPVDSEKVSVEAKWKNNKDFGPCKTISSTAKIIGETLLDNETNADLLANYLLSYWSDDAKLSKERVQPLIDELSVTKNDLTYAVVKKAEISYTDTDEKEKVLSTLYNYGYISNSYTEPTSEPVTTTEPTTVPATSSTDPTTTIPATTETNTTVATTTPSTTQATQSTQSTTNQNNSDNTVKSGQGTGMFSILATLMGVSAFVMCLFKKKKD